MNKELEKEIIKLKEELKIARIERKILELKIELRICVKKAGKLKI